SRTNSSMSFTRRYSSRGAPTSRCLALSTQAIARLTIAAFACPSARSASPRLDLPLARELRVGAARRVHHVVMRAVGEQGVLVEELAVPVPLDQLHVADLALGRIGLRPRDLVALGLLHLHAEAVERVG